MNTKTRFTSRQRAYLEQLRRILPASPAWEAWLAASGELPPDFASEPSCEALPDPLAGVIDARAWAQRREELQELFSHWVLGITPPPPNNLTAQVLAEADHAHARSQTVVLTFGPQPQAHLHVELLIPHGAGPFPVFATQSDHRGWALLALQRGYIGAVYAACDSDDDSAGFPAVYPDADWACLPRRAWAASRLVDYLVTLPTVNPRQIVLTGHSRNAKQACIAAAFDERISAVIASSAGALGTLPTRCFSEQHFGEGIELITRAFPDWFHPRLRFFTGREGHLPVDMHELVALSAPRPCLISSALNDRCESVWAVQQSFLAAQRVYRFLEVENNLSLMWRPGGHETYTETIERYLDWCDGCFAPVRGTEPPRFVCPVNWAAQAEHNQPQPVSVAPAPPDLFADVNSAADWQTARAATLARLPALLGQQPPAAINPGHDYGTEPPHLATLLDHESNDAGIAKTQTIFGEYINADIYLPTDYATRSTKLPAVLWFPPCSYPNGYRAAYFHGRQFYSRLAQQGFAVFCFDPIGMGRRIEEAEHFHRRYPAWSLLGKMVRDAAAALEVLTRLSYVETNHIWGVGYGLGSLVGLCLAASDPRLTGLAAVCLPPLSASQHSPAGGGGRDWLERFDLLPHRDAPPSPPPALACDLAALIACAAPRPMLVVSPQLDREGDLEAVTQWVAAAGRAYKVFDAAGRLTLATPEDYHRLSTATQSTVIDWLKAQAKQEPIS